ncbi:MAG: putative toxin-antitoxin system toxin component, PIN family [Cyanobacteriota bacterium]|nr:putative toxin-antitoxin system toxin component, PIN family [Cyanobacteriota bacterium]
MKTLRAVLDTNVLLSALLFNNGRMGWLRQYWQAGLVTPVLSETTGRELIKVLGYPKFRLNAEEIHLLLEDLLPWCETWEQPISTSATLRVRDPADQPFLDLALASHVEVLVCGDNDLLVLANQLHAPRILSPAAFRTWLDQGRKS